MATSIILVFVVSEIVFGNINYRRTLTTSYNSSPKKGWQIVKTSWGTLETPSGWIHIANYPTCPGYVGSFLTLRGIVSYDYGMYAPSYEKNNYSDDEKYRVTVESLDNREIKIIRNENEVGIHIPLQDDMKYGFTIYPEKHLNKDFEELKHTIATIEFKK